MDPEKKENELKASRSLCESEIQKMKNLKKRSQFSESGIRKICSWVLGPDKGPSEDVQISRARKLEKNLRREF
jgi:hypothetical protein